MNTQNKLLLVAIIALLVYCYSMKKKAGYSYARRIGGSAPGGVNFDSDVA